MLVKFRNTNVPIHHLRQGVVVMLESAGSEDFYYHIHAFEQVDGDVAYLLLDDTYGNEGVPSTSLTWLSPV